MSVAPGQATASLLAGSGRPVVVKQGDLFLLCTPEGDVLPGTEQGLYFHDMRHLCAETLRLQGLPLVSLLADAQDQGRAIFELTNRDLPAAPDARGVRKRSLGIRREKRLGQTYEQRIQVQNFTTEPVRFALSLRVAADFADMFQVRGAVPARRGTLEPPDWQDTTLWLRYQGADGHLRQTVLRFSARPDVCQAGDLTYHLALEGREVWQLTMAVSLSDGAAAGAARTSIEVSPSGGEPSTLVHLQVATTGVAGANMAVETDHELFNEILSQSFRDLRLLAMRQGGQEFFAAGVPWYVALFGRDSLLTAIQMAAFDLEIGAQTLRVLAAHQGRAVDDWRDEQPGKILHELRVGEMATLGEVPQTPYYGAVDSTPLFLVLLGVHAAWCGSLELFHELREPVEAALAWLATYADEDGDGYLDYRTRSTRGLRNQGWKDSGNAIVLEDGALAEPPIALPEVQGYAYLAWRLMADLYRRAGEPRTADELDGRAERLYAAFNRDFWLPAEGYYALCRQADGRYSRSISSNPAHALWTGIVAAERAAAVARRALQPDLFTGWGLRTLSSADRSYNPVDYQVGSVWPHDTAFAMAGLHRYGFTAEAGQLFTGLVRAATRFERFRLPETFAGYSSEHSRMPVEYPVACSPQAWAAGAMPLMLQVALGLQPDAFNRRLRIQTPALPEWLGWVAVRGLRVGEARVDLRYARSEGATHVAVLGKVGDLAVSVEQ